MLVGSNSVLGSPARPTMAVAELAIDPSRVKKYAHDQFVADEKNVTLVALWFHGVSQNEFTNEWVWPVWDPSLEVPS